MKRTVGICFRHEQDATVCQGRWMIAQEFAEALQEWRADVFIAVNAGKDQHGLGSLFTFAEDIAPDWPAFD